jgi:hypothetical protein
LDQVSEAKCSVCGAKAVWEYMPADGIGEYCDQHVPRGCSCNRSFNPETDDWDGPEPRDESGRLQPCCEYWFTPEGFEPTDPSEIEEHRKRMEEWVRTKLVTVSRSTLQKARGWLALTASDPKRPPTSDIHAVITEIDAAIAMEAGTAMTEGHGPKDDSAGPKDIAQGQSGLLDSRKGWAK